MSDTPTVSAALVAQAIRARLADVPTKKLHKLLYYCQGHHVAVFGSPLFRETISAWDMGPVVGRLWISRTSPTPSCPGGAPMNHDRRARVRASNSSGWPSTSARPATRTRSRAASRSTRALFVTGSQTHRFAGKRWFDRTAETLFSLAWLPVPDPAQAWHLENFLECLDR